MSLLLSGSCGFIGSNLVRHIFRHTNHRVVNLDCLTYAGNRRSLANVEDDPRYRFVKVDLCDADAVRRAVAEADPDAVMHLAAESHVDRSIDGPGQFIQTNILGTFNLLQAALGHYRNLDEPRRRPFRFLRLHRRSLRVAWDGRRGLHGTDALPAALAHSASRPPRTTSPALARHLRAAGAGDQLLEQLRPLPVPREADPVVMKCLREEPIPVYGAGESVRDWLYVEDIAALLTVLERGTPRSTYNIGGNNELTNLALVRMLCGILDELHPRADRRPYAHQIEFVTDRPGHDLRYAIDAAKIRTELAWRPQEQSDTGFRKTVQWYLDNRDWWQHILSGDYRLCRLGTGS